MCHFLQRECDELIANAITQHLLSTSVSAAFWNLYLIMWICVSHEEYGTLEQPTAHCMWNVTLIFLSWHIWFYFIYSENFRSPSTARGGICPCRQCRRQCKFFASGVNFNISTVVSLSDGYGKFFFSGKDPKQRMEGDHWWSGVIRNYWIKGSLHSTHNQNLDKDPF